jgi:hypothetical protein
MELLQTVKQDSWDDVRRKILNEIEKHGEIVRIEDKYSGNSNIIDIRKYYHKDGHYGGITGRRLRWIDRGIVSKEIIEAEEALPKTHRRVEKRRALTHA